MLRALSNHFECQWNADYACNPVPLAKYITANACLILNCLSFFNQVCSQLLSRHFSPRGQRHDGMWEKAPLVQGLSSSQLHSHGSKCRRRKKKRKKDPNSTKEAVCNSSWPTHTTSAWSQWWCSNLTDWAQGLVCLKPLTYFYSHCRSQSLYSVIAELMQHVYSKTGRRKIANGEAFEMFVKWYLFLII